MGKMRICAVAVCAALCVSGCRGFGPIIGNLQDSVESPAQVETGNDLIDEAGDMMVGPETETNTEMDMIVADEEALKMMTEAASEGVGAAQAGADTAAQAAAGEQGTETAVPGGAGEQEAAQVKAPETETETEAETEGSLGPIERPLKELIGAREANGENWAIAYEDLETGEQYGHREEEILQSASVVKLFIMGAVYRYMCYPPEGEEALTFGESYPGQLRDTIVAMITVSDNDCANLLIDRLGGGDFGLGAQRIKTFCEENGYVGTSIGRRFLEQNPSGDNYTTAADTRKFLSDLYHGTLVNEEASAKMLEIVKGQTRKNKIPAGLPAGFTSGNKTGEMPEGYGLGCIENDSAIVFAPEGMGKGYILTVMSTNLGGRNSEAISVIGQISSMVAQWYIEQHSEAQTEPQT